MGNCAYEETVKGDEDEVNEYSDKNAGTGNLPVSLEDNNMSGLRSLPIRLKDNKASEVDQNYLNRIPLNRSSW